MLELKNITYIVNDNGEERKILDNVSCVFSPACLTAITGHNGSGKSTLTKIIMGIIKPTSGTILFNGKDITNLSIDERVNLGINYAFQQPVTFKGITIKELIDIASKPGGTDFEAAKHFGVAAKLALGLPGIYTTSSSALLLKNAISQYAPLQENIRGDKLWISQVII